MRLLLDEMYSPRIAERLRELGHDVVSAKERDDLASHSDDVLFEAMRVEGRAILTNNVGDFMQLVRSVVSNGSYHSGVVLTSDRSLPRRRDDIQTYVDLLHELLCAHPGEDALRNDVRWLRSSDQ